MFNPKSFRTVLVVLIESTSGSSAHYVVSVEKSRGISFPIGDHLHWLPCCSRAFSTICVVFGRGGRSYLLRISPYSCHSRAKAPLFGCSGAETRVVDLRINPSIVIGNGCCHTFLIDGIIPFVILRHGRCHDNLLTSPGLFSVRALALAQESGDT